MPGLSINFNPAESFALSRLAYAQTKTAKSLERLSTGKQINRAADNPSGLIGSEHLKSEQVKVLRTLEAYQQDLSRYGALDGALAGVNDLLGNLNGRVVTAANAAGLSDGEKKAYQLEIDASVKAINHITSTARFKGELLLQGYLGDGATVSYAGTESGTLANQFNAGGGLKSLMSGGANSLSGNLEEAQKVVEALHANIASQRGAVGAEINRVESLSRELTTRNENLAAAISGIVDTDIAKETGELVRSQIVEQANLATVQIAREIQAETVLDLIKNNLEQAKHAASQD